eukprot:GHVS01055380.1.p1 GENE.GHVS01055380.1~~GHVS01055380.1.p1  ORF type:complete len:267 (-),score=12.54 GHVS01055380.1:443-1243(-)
MMALRLLPPFLLLVSAMVAESTDCGRGSAQSTHRVATVGLPKLMLPNDELSRLWTASGRADKFSYTPKVTRFIPGLLPLKEFIIEVHRNTPRKFRTKTSIWAAMIETIAQEYVSVSNEADRTHEQVLRLLDVATNTAEHPFLPAFAYTTFTPEEGQKEISCIVRPVCEECNVMCGPVIPKSATEDIYLPWVQNFNRRVSKLHFISVPAGADGKAATGSNGPAPNIPEGSDSCRVVFVDFDVNMDAANDEGAPQPILKPHLVIGFSP